MYQSRRRDKEESASLKTQKEAQVGMQTESQSRQKPVCPEPRAMGMLIPPSRTPGPTREGVTDVRGKEQPQGTPAADLDES